MPHRRLAVLYGERDLPVHRSTLLSVMFAAGSMLCLLAVVLGQEPSGENRALFVAAAVGAVVAVVLWSRRHRRQHLWVLQTALVLFSLLVAVVAAQSDSVNDVTSLGPAVIMTCAYAGCFYSRSALWLQVTVSVGSYGAGAALSGPSTAWTSVATAGCVAIGLAVVLHQLTSLLRQRSHLDQLTQTVSRAVWMRIAEDALQSRGRRPLTVAMLDLDKFKQINDTLGHLAGDDLLRSVCQAWRDALGGDGLLGRYGGDEFVVLFLDTSADRARQLLDRVALAHPAKWTAGVASAQPGDDLASLLDKVDVQLRRNKRGPVLPEQPSPMTARPSRPEPSRTLSPRP